MVSHLSRLFTYAKSPNSAPIENFTTEALANALRSDHRPFALALHGLGIPFGHGRINVQTQVVLAGTGILDLFVTSDGHRPIIVEVKVNADESGDQIARYKQWIAAQDPANRPWLLTLGPRRITDDDDVRWMSWQSLRKHAMEATASLYWHELAAFLMDIGVADDGHISVTADEASVLLPAHDLLAKTARIVMGAVSFANDRWPRVVWPADLQQIRKKMLQEFAVGPWYALIDQSDFRAGLAMGAYQERGSASVWLGLWTRVGPKRVKERAQIAACTSSLQDEHWMREENTWNPVGAYAPLRSFPDNDSATQWLTDRLTDLANVGLMDLIPRLGMLPPDEQGDAEERG